jgi:hypothetical protein
MISMARKTLEGMLKFDQGKDGAAMHIGFDDLMLLDGSQHHTPNKHKIY